MDSFAKYAEESMKKIPADLKGGAVITPTQVQTAFLDSLFPSANSVPVLSPPAVVEAVVPKVVEGGVDYAGPLPVLQGSDFTVGGIYWSEGDYWGLINGIVRFGMAMTLYLVLYWLLAPGQLLQLYNSRFWCNRKIYGTKNTTQTTRTALNAQFGRCKGITALPYAGAQLVPQTAGTDYVGSWMEWSDCNEFLTCTRRAGWSTYYSSFPSIIIHGIVLGVVLSLVPLLKESLGFIGIDYILKTLADMLTYLMGWTLYLLVGLPIGIFYGYESTLPYMPDYSRISNY